MKKEAFQKRAFDNDSSVRQIGNNNDLKKNQDY